MKLAFCRRRTAATSASICRCSSLKDSPWSPSAPGTTEAPVAVSVALGEPKGLPGDQGLPGRCRVLPRLGEPLGDDDSWRR